MGLIDSFLTHSRAAVVPLPVAAVSRFDRTVNAMNRLPRPLMALGVVALFGHAMLDPGGFATRMAALRAMPEALWWLIGGIVTFYFGARESHYLRRGAEPPKDGPDRPA